MKNIISFLILYLLLIPLCFSQVQPSEGGGFHQEGVAAWYGPEYAGRQTQSGELFDPNQFTAAHRELPFGSIVTVTNMLNGKQVNVRINDRGPGNPGRIIDVSKIAAERLDMLNNGTAQVSIEFAPPGVTTAQQPRSNTPPTYTNTAPASNYTNTAPTSNYTNTAPASTYTNTAPASNYTNTASASTYTNVTPTSGYTNTAPTSTYTNVTPSSGYTNTVPGSTYTNVTPSRASQPQAQVASNGIPVVNDPANTAAKSGRLPAPMQPTLPAATPRQPDSVQQPVIQPMGTPTPPAQARPAAPQNGMPNTGLPRVQQDPRLPATTQPAVVAATTRSPYTVQSPAVEQPAQSAPLPQGNPILPSTAPRGTTGQLQPVSTANRPPAASPARPTANINAYPQASVIPDSLAEYPSYETAEIFGGPIRQGQIYRLQVGSYSKTANAIEAIERLRKVGLTALYEPYGEWSRVVVGGVRAEDVQYVAKKIGNAGFREVIVRVEG
jgi:rare lipoprotein A